MAGPGQARRQFRGQARLSPSKRSASSPSGSIARVGHARPGCQRERAAAVDGIPGLGAWHPKERAIDCHRSAVLAAARDGTETGGVRVIRARRNAAGEARSHAGAIHGGTDAARAGLERDRYHVMERAEAKGAQVGLVRSRRHGVHALTGWGRDSFPCTLSVLHTYPRSVRRASHWQAPCPSRLGSGPAPAP